MQSELVINFHVWLAKDDCMLPDKSKDKKVCILKYKESLEELTIGLEILDNNNLPCEIELGIKSTDALLAFLEGRVLPANRMFLAEQLKPLGINPNNWIKKMELNKGRVCGDEYYIEIEYVSKRVEI